MNAPFPEGLVIPAEFQQCLEAQRQAYLAHPEPAYKERLADLQTLARLIKENRDALVAAIQQDYGTRSEFETLFAEFFVVLETIKDSAKQLKSCAGVSTGSCIPAPRTGSFRSRWAWWA
jgi:coniferyl-aldehyde dehydrogenase